MQGEIESTPKSAHTITLIGSQFHERSSGLGMRKPSPIERRAISC